MCRGRGEANAAGSGPQRGGWSETRCSSARRTRSNRRERSSEAAGHDEIPAPDHGGEQGEQVSCDGMGKDGHGWLKRFGRSGWPSFPPEMARRRTLLPGRSSVNRDFVPSLRVHGHAGTAVLPCCVRWRNRVDLSILISGEDIPCVCSSLPICTVPRKPPRFCAGAARSCLPDMLVLLGDYLYHGPRNPLPSSYGPPSVVSVFADFETPIVAVRGNCDAEVDLMLFPSRWKTAP